MNSNFTIVNADWKRDRMALKLVRETVFVLEQHVPPEMEWDELDENAFHVLARDHNAQPIGAGRLTQDFRIGRMAVLKEWRGEGVGTALLQQLTQHARARGDKEIVLNAQVSAIPFYANHGYSEEGARFIEAGILHQRMRIKLEFA